jgi:hypothetical protein
VRGQIQSTQKRDTLISHGPWELPVELLEEVVMVDTDNKVAFSVVMSND